MRPSFAIAWTRKPLLATGVAFAVALCAGSALAGVEVGVGDTATIELDGNPSTGFRWTLDDGASQSPELVKVEDLRPVLGAPSKYQFRVTGLEAGSVKLVFMYVRANDTAPAKTQEVSIEVGN